jgi:hypothetical protein
VHRDEGCNGQSPAQRKSISEERAAGVGNALQDVRRASLSRVLSPAACADRHQARIGRTKRLRQAVLHGRRIGQPVLWDIPACVLTELGLRAGLRGVYLFAVTALRLPSQHGASAGFMRSARPGVTCRGTRSTLVMKGSAVRVRASASLQQRFAERKAPCGGVVSSQSQIWVRSARGRVPSRERGNRSRARVSVLATVRPCSPRRSSVGTRSAQGDALEAEFAWTRDERRTEASEALRTSRAALPPVPTTSRPSGG